MLGLRRNCHDDASDAEHVKLKPLLQTPPPQWPSSSLALASSQPILLLQRLQLNQHLNERITFSLELYHKNVIKKLPATATASSFFNKFQVFRLSKNVCQT